MDFEQLLRDQISSCATLGRCGNVAYYQGFPLVCNRKPHADGDHEFAALSGETDGEVLARWPRS